MYDQVKTKINLENDIITSKLRTELNSKSKLVLQMNDIKIKLERSKREKEEAISSLKLESEKKLSLMIQEKESHMKKNAEDQYLFKIKELEKKLDDQKKLTNQQKQKLEQGSMQLQGEVQEEAIEDWLKLHFPIDLIKDINKGAFGADVLQTVNEFDIQNCGSIYYESKRTKTFDVKWIKKFKSDMQKKNVDIGVLVTQTMPQGMTRMGMIDDVYVCSFEEFKGLSFILRNVIIDFSRIKTTKENIGDKKSMLYNYLTSNQFRSSMENIVNAYVEMKKNLDKEKMQSISNFEKRRGHLDVIISKTGELYGRFNGIAGGTMPKVKLLEFDDNPTVTNIELLKKTL